MDQILIMSFILITDSLNGNQLTFNVREGKEKKLKWRGRKYMKINDELLTQIPGFFKIERNDKLVSCDSEVCKQIKDDYEIVNEKDEKTGQTGHNAEIYWKDKPQQLTHEQIKNLSAEKKGEEMIEILKKSNKNFNKRSKISQQKYIKRKEQKYKIILFIEKCSIYNLNTYFLNRFKDYYFLREDSIAYFLNHIHFKKNMNFFVHEKTKGILSSYLLKKTDDSNKVCLFDPLNEFCKINYKKFEAMKFLNLRDKFEKHMKIYNKDNIDNIPTIDHVLIATDFDVLSILTKINNKLNENCKVIIYSRFYEIAKQVYDYFVKEKFVEIKIHDFFYRIYQVLPQRTHPEMKGNTMSGFIITAYKIGE